MLKTYPDNHFDSIITDPPYGLSFLGKDWDKNTGAVETWEQCLRVLKPGGYLLAFSAARTYHRLASNLEDCGFEIRDQIMWIYASGFPKAQDMGKAIQKRIGIKESKEKVLEQQGGFNNWSDTNEDKNNQRENETIKEVVCTDPEAVKWSGWKTALKPAHEPIVMARKPYNGSCVNNVLKHGTGAMNIDESRIKYNEGEETHQQNIRIGQVNATNGTNFFNTQKSKVSEIILDGRYPSNILGDLGEYQKYFYCPKISRSERHIGFEKTESIKDLVESVGGVYDPNNANGTFLPGVGYIKSHGIRHEVDKIRKSDSYTGPKTLPKRLSPLCDPGEKRNITERIVTDISYKKGNGLNRVCEFCNAPILKPELCHCTKKSWIIPIQLGNNHPTVKPVALMSYLVKLVTPKGGKILDPFNGSGSTGMAATDNSFDYTGIELDQDYVDISIKRIEAWSHRNDPDNEYLKLFNE